jgi:hypothetical protein
VERINRIQEWTESPVVELKKNAILWMHRSFNFIAMLACWKVDLLIHFTGIVYSLAANPLWWSPGGLNKAADLPDRLDCQNPVFGSTLLSLN